MTKIAITQYELEQLPSWQAYEDKIVRLIEQAKGDDIELITMGEYAGLELASWTENNLQKQFEYIQTLLPKYKELFLSLANQNQVFIQSGTLPVKDKDDYYRNRAYFFTPDGEVFYQDKMFLTPFELRTQLFRAGSQLNLFSTPFAKIGIVISYDSEFPLVVKLLTQAGADLILIPSCTEKISGLTRVSISARARAIENQCYVAHSCLIGKASWNTFIDINIGESGIYCPADSGFPEDGILAKAQLNTPMIIGADLSWDQVNHVREHGEMLNFQDMQKEIDLFNIISAET